MWIAGRVTRALCSAFIALQTTACASRIVADAANGVRNDLAVRSIASLESAWVESPPNGGLVLCGTIAIQPPRLSPLGTPEAERQTQFAAYVSAARLAGEEPALPFGSFYARYGSACACLAKVEGLRAIAVGSGTDQPGVTLVDPAGASPREATLEQQSLHVDALPGVTLRAVDLRLGPRGGNLLYWAPLPVALAWDGAFLGGSLAIGAPLYVVSSGIRWVASLFSTEREPPLEPAPPRDPCAGASWWYVPGGRR
jgi:hypothetical protein